MLNIHGNDNVRISKFKNIFAKKLLSKIHLKKLLRLKKLKNTVVRTYVISDVNGKEIDGTFYKKELQKTNQSEFRIEEVIKRKGDKLYFKRKGYDNSFNNWFYKKEIVI